MVAHNTDPRAIADRLRMTLSAIGCDNLADAARLFSVNPQTVSNWINAYSLIPLEYAEILADHHVSLDWLYRGPVVRFRDGDRPFRRGRPRKGEPA